MGLSRIIESKRPQLDRFRDLFRELIEPEVKTPRDLVRLLNPLKVTWSAVKDIANIEDFLCIETLRMKRPELYFALRSNKNYLTNIPSSTAVTVTAEGRQEHPQAQTCEDIFLKPAPEDERERLRRGLMLLFPALAHIWEPGKHKEDSPYICEDQCRICSANHFDMYFRFTRSDDV